MPERRNYAQDPEYRHPLQRFRKLMPHRVRRVLLVASRYDSFLLGEDGRLGDLILNEFLDLSLGADPWLTRVSTGSRALAAVRHREFDLVLMTLHIRDIDVHTLVQQLKQDRPSLPVVPLAFDDRELLEVSNSPVGHLFVRPYVWQGDVRLPLAIMQSIEDQWNVDNDVAKAGVSVVILVEDNPHFYSSYVPMLYSTLLRQSQVVMSEGINLVNKLMRMRARPKILHCTNFEEAVKCFERFEDSILGLISDVHFPKDGELSPLAGLELATLVRASKEDLPILLQTNETDIAKKAEKLRAKVARKGSPRLLHEVERFITQNFGFGDFVFRMEDGTEITRVKDVRELEEALESAPPESVGYHAANNHFSTWLRARTEFRLAEDLRRYSADEFDSLADLRDFLHDTLHEFRREGQSGVVAVFDPHEFIPTTSFAQIGGGSLGGKARGLGFLRKILSNYRVRRLFPNTEITVPAAVVLTTDIFDAFMEDNDLLEFAMDSDDDDAIEECFLHARLPRETFEDLTAFLDLVHHPLAVRSSSLLEDSQDVSFTGVYKTYMIPNCHPDRAVRRRQLLNAVKRVFASTFNSRAKEYIAPTPYRLEEEKMAVVIQTLAGRRHEDRYYPDVSGVMRSYNFYPVSPMKPEDGIVSIALGLGEEVVGGGKAVSFCPLYPKHPIHFTTPDSIVENSQRHFFALDMSVSENTDPGVEIELSRFGIEDAVKDGTMTHVGSTYVPDSHAVYDGMGREGVPVVTFWGILKDQIFPLADVCQLILNIGARSMNRPVEIEFAVKLPKKRGEQAQFSFLQMRPFVLKLQTEDVDVSNYPRADLLCSSNMVLGSGRPKGIRDIVCVDHNTFDRAKSREVGRIVAEFNGKLVKDGRPYLLIGVGRWGASDPWLGIPVTWEQIQGARVIVESGLRDFDVVPSQGSHFFQNLTSAEVGYFTIPTRREDEFVDWDWFPQQTLEEQVGCVHHIRVDSDIEIRMDGRRGCGVILKPRADEA